MIGLYFLGSKGLQFSVSRELEVDRFFYAIFGYGLLITFLAMVSTSFGMGHFFNDAFQVGLYLTLFFIIKNLKISLSDWFLLMRMFFAGIILNAFYIFYLVYFSWTGFRPPGFMDNPNFVALSIAIAIVYALVQFDIYRKWSWKIACLLLVGWLFLVFVIEGSRTSAVVLSGAMVLVFYFASTMKRLVFMFSIILGGFWISVSTNIDGLISYNILASRLSNSNHTEDPRFALWRGATRAAIETDFIGLGIGQFTQRFPEFFQNENNYLIYKFVRFGTGLSTHNDYFALLSEYGLFGLVAYLVFIVLSLRKIWGLIEGAEAHYQLKLAYQFNFIALVSLVIFGFGAENFLSPMYWFLLAITTKIIQV